MLRAERQDDSIVRRRGLQLEVKRAAEPFPQGQSPRPIQPDAEGRVDDQLHPAGLIEEAFQNDLFLRRNDAQRLVGCGKVVRQLPRAAFAEIGLAVKKVSDGPVGRLSRSHSSFNIFAQVGDSAR